MLLRLTICTLLGLLSLPAQTPLKDAFAGVFRVGAALNPGQFTGTDKISSEIVKTQFNTISPENVLKWGLVHLKPGEYNFAPADRYVEFGVANHMYIVGHCLVWHSQVPKWVFEDEQGKPLGREALLERMRDHINTVVGRYKGRISSWDVVNEALNEDGTMRQTPWLKGIGEDYIAKAFEFAHAADPAAELNYNDYSLANPAKRRGAVELIRKLKAAGVPVSVVGLQDHQHLNGPSIADEEATIVALKALGVKLAITELDVDVLPRATRQMTADVATRVEARADLNPYTAGLPLEVSKQLAQRYAELFRLYRKHSDAIQRVTFWGVTDAASWLNNFPARGRTNYPLLFDRAGQPKPALDAVLAVAREK